MRLHKNNDFSTVIKDKIRSREEVRKRCFSKIHLGYSTGFLLGERKYKVWIQRDGIPAQLITVQPVKILKNYLISTP